MLVSQKSQYALRAIYELAYRSGQRPIKISEIAEAQAVPIRFLEVILSQLKQGGFIDSKRGSDGGYILLRPANKLTVGEILRFVQGPIGPVECVNNKPASNCPLLGKCTFLPMWEKVRDAMAGVYDNTTFQDLVDQHGQLNKEFTPCYAI